MKNLHPKLLNADGAHLGKISDELANFDSAASAGDQKAGGVALGNLVRLIRCPEDGGEYMNWSRTAGARALREALVAGNPS